MYGDGTWKHINSRKYIYGKWVHYTLFINIDFPLNQPSIIWYKHQNTLILNLPLLLQSALVIYRVEFLITVHSLIQSTVLTTGQGDTLITNTLFSQFTSSRKTYFGPNTALLINLITFMISLSHWFNWSHCTNVVSIYYWKKIKNVVVYQLFNNNYNS